MSAIGNEAGGFAVPAQWPGRGRIGQLAVRVLFALPILFVAAGFRLVSHSTLEWLSTWGSGFLFLSGMVICVVRAARASRDRGVWIAFALAALSWTLANFYSAFAYGTGPDPVVSPSDAGYLAFPAFFAVGLLRYVRVRLPRVPIGAWIDAVIVALAAAALSAAIIFERVTVHAESFTAVVTTLAYPVEDIAIVGLIVGAGSVLGWRLGTAGRLIAAAIVSITVSDILTITAVLEGSAYGGAWANAGWTAGIALLAAAAVSEVPAGPQRRRPAGVAGVAVPALAALAAMGVILLTVGLRLSPIALGLASAAIGLVIVRLMLSLREVRSLADSRTLAMTDDLTGLPNRRRLLADLASACASPTLYVLMLFDLDGFKQFNDFHGHTAGDELLAGLAAALKASLPAGGRAYRLGGDEFCVLLPAPDRSDPTRNLGEAQIVALTAAGRDWSVAPSWGSVRLGEEARDPAGALGLADRRMYAQKRRRPGSARQQVRDALLRALGEQQPTLHAHARDVTDWVERVARLSGMSDDEVDDAVRAAELHDIGKLAIPASILDKPGPLDDQEFAVIRTHTIIGERMLLSAPALRSVAPIVRASHERWDGKGYPDGLAREEIPLAARIVSVCDSFDAMVADRPYRPARTPSEALDELRRCAGTQFDPRVVEIFAELMSVAATLEGRPV